MLDYVRKVSVLGHAASGTQPLRLNGQREGDRPPPRHTAFWSPNACALAIEKLHDSRCLLYPKGTARGVVQRTQRHVCDTITTLRWMPYQGIIMALCRKWRYS